MNIWVNSITKITKTDNYWCPLKCSVMQINHYDPTVLHNVCGFYVGNSNNAYTSICLIFWESIICTWTIVVEKWENKNAERMQSI